MARPGTDRARAVLLRYNNYRIRYSCATFVSQMVPACADRNKLYATKCYKQTKSRLSLLAENEAVSSLLFHSYDVLSHSVCSGNTDDHWRL